MQKTNTLPLHYVTLRRDICIAASLERIPNQVMYVNRQSEHCSCGSTAIQKKEKEKRYLFARRKANLLLEKFDLVIPHQKKSNFFAKSTAMHQQHKSALRLKRRRSYYSEFQMVGTAVFQLWLYQSVQSISIFSSVLTSDSGYSSVFQTYLTVAHPLSVLLQVAAATGAPRFFQTLPAAQQVLRVLHRTRVVLHSISVHIPGAQQLAEAVLAENSTQSVRAGEPTTRPASPTHPPHSLSFAARVPHQCARYTGVHALAICATAQPCCLRTRCPCDRTDQEHRPRDA